MNLADVYKDVEQTGAKIYPYNIGFCDAATLEMNGKYAIFLDFSKFDTLADMTWSLGHEAAHCATGCTHKLSSSYDLIEKHEFKANRYAIEKYLPVSALCAAMRGGCTTVYDLAQHFGVPEAAIRQALQYWTECRGVDFNRAAGG
ncbi:MAG: ImmA/IrrE family metallo-endopeptidase [Gemmiger sp.]